MRSTFAVLAALPIAANAQTGSFVATLGRDTMHLERFTRRGTVLEGIVVSRVPETRVLKYQMSYDAAGNVTRYEMRITDAAGAPVKTLNQASNMAPTTLVADAHRLGLFVHPFTFRDEAARLTATYKGDPKAEYKAFFDAGVDGVFTDFSGTGRAALEEWLKTRKAR